MIRPVGGIWLSGTGRKWVDGRIWGALKQTHFTGRGFVTTPLPTDRPFSTYSDGPFLSPAKECLRNYDPTIEKGLLRRFAAISLASTEKAKQDILDFAEEFGLLGGVRVSLANANGDSGTEQEFEPFHYWCEEVARLQVLFRVAECLKEPNAANDAELRTLIATDGPLPTFRLGRNVGLRIDIPAFDPFRLLMIGQELSFASDIHSTAYILLRHHINEQLATDVRPAVDLAPRSPVYLIPKTLLGAIYLKLAAAYVGKSPEWRLCRAEDCDNLVTDPDPRKLYCCTECMNRAKNGRRFARRRNENNA